MTGIEQADRRTSAPAFSLLESFVLLQSRPSKLIFVDGTQVIAKMPIKAPLAIKQLVPAAFLIGPLHSF
jgi:hypothetical protein